eukprot:CAMPEP_0119012062 /NCGR_PEP_ID=MMETSP1176-20130426/6057_1 /TAXON_ID=265551 /ORGANISM="Synedropsis recta cf, Strain CCMP1620" /LENGTH=313 /DNA_ID=CAMNT_0006964965 /DNA_START=105 /DNA_END=1045 /DNA_ORIENTATION=+
MPILGIVTVVSLLLLLLIDSTHSFSASSSSSSSTTSSFQQFVFSPNGVCIQPAFFVLHSDETVDDDSTDGINTQQQEQLREFTMKNVPGDGDCMFLATALATATSMGLGANDVLLRQLARETRQVVADIFATNNNTTLLVQGKRLVSTHQLLQAAAREESLSPEVYLQQLRKEGCEGGLYGGGPELTVLSNVLRRPISIYELADIDDSAADLSADDSPTRFLATKDCRSIVCKGVFGLPHFADPCQSIPQSAILQPNLQPGAYSWHLHLLIVQASPQEKHALCPVATNSDMSSVRTRRGTMTKRWDSQYEEVF